MDPEALLMEEACGFVASARNLGAQCGRFTYRKPREMYVVNVVFAFIGGAQSASHSGFSHRIQDS